MTRAMNECPKTTAGRVAFVVGIDLAGPANHEDTWLAWFSVERRRLCYAGGAAGLSDEAVLAHEVMARKARASVAIDSPLSYNDGGGDRPGDASLRCALRDRGLPTAMVMAPTARRMAYLTLRGVGLSCALTRAAGQVEVIEVHPGASMALQGAPMAALKAYKSDDATSCRQLCKWLSSRGIRGLPSLGGPSYMIDACAAGLAAWHWSRGAAAWLHPGEPPLHPFDFVC